jgi:hypothetical protein
MAGPFFTRPNFEDRQMVQYSGRTITLSGDTNINQTGNLRIQKGAFPGLVATSLDSDGTIVWGPVSGLSWSISACTSPLYVNNLVSCPSSGGTIQVDAGNLALNSELNFLISLSAGTNTDEILVIDNNGYVKTIPNLMGIGNMWHIPVGYTLTVPDNYQSFIYGDILIEGTIDLQTNAQLVILNGNLILSGGSIIGSGTTYLVTLGGGSGCCFTGGTGSCITDLYVTNIHGCSPINIQPISSDDVYMVMGGGKVGIGTSSPSYLLTVSGISNTTSGFVVGDELGGYVQSGYHKVQIVADGTKTPLVIQGGSGAVEIWKDTSPTAAASLGMNVPGFSGTSDFVFASYNGSNWAETARITNNGNVGINNENPNERLHVSGTTIINSDNMMLSDTLTTIPTLPNFKGLIVSHDYSNNNGIVSSNTNPSGSTAIFFANDSLVTGQMGVGGSQSIRAGSPVDGVNFYRNKIVLRGNSLSDGMVFNPNSNDTTGTFWWEFAGISGMILKGNGGDKAYLGLGLNPDGTEMPTSNIQIGGTGNTGTFKYRDGNQSSGYILTSDTDGNANWQPLDFVLSGGCVSDICVKQLYSVRDVYIKGLTFGTGGSDSASTGTTYVTNTAGGKDVLLSNTTGYKNTGFGSEVLTANTIGYSNTAVGAYSLKENTSGTFNTAVGESSLKVNTVGVNNTAIGVLSLSSNISGYNNVAIGLESLRGNVTGFQNVSVGDKSLRLNYDGFDNTSIGWSALSVSLSGNQNTAIGSYAIGLNTNGVRNTGVGYRSLFSNTDGYGNTSLGWSAGDANLIGNYNTFLGLGSNCITTNLTNATAIGYNSTVNQSNSMVLGNGVINVGVGTSTPSSTVHVEGLNGYNQFRLVTQYTPTGTTDTNGLIGDTAWDDNFIYIKTTAGWKRTGLSTF